MLPSSRFTTRRISRGYTIHAHTYTNIPSIHATIYTAPSFEWNVRCDIDRVADLSPFKCLSRVSFCFIRWKLAIGRAVSECDCNKLTSRMQQCAYIYCVCMYAYHTMLQCLVFFFFLYISDLFQIKYLRTSFRVLAYNCRDKWQRSGHYVAKHIRLLCSYDRFRTCSTVYLYRTTCTITTRNRPTSINIIYIASGSRACNC